MLVRLSFQEKSRKPAGITLIFLGSIVLLPYCAHSRNSDRKEPEANWPGVYIKTVSGVERYREDLVDSDSAFLVISLRRPCKYWVYDAGYFIPMTETRGQLATDVALLENDRCPFSHGSCLPPTKKISARDQSKMTVGDREYQKIPSPYFSSSFSKLIADDKYSKKFMRFILEDGLVYFYTSRREEGSAFPKEISCAVGMTFPLLDFKGPKKIKVIKLKSGLLMQ
jgi:hypothetical protein